MITTTGSGDTKPTYAWRDGVRGIGSPRLSVQVVGERLNWLQETKGRILPSDVVEDARPAGSPLHDGFEWDNDKAAEEYRLDQARNLIRGVVAVVGQESNGEPIAVRVFVQVEETNTRFYINTMTAMANPAMREYVLRQALLELAAFQRKYGHLSELAAVFAAAEQVRGGGKKRQKKVAVAV